MSYYQQPPPPPGGYSQYPSQSPQPGYQQPPPGQYPPPSTSPYPPQQGYPPPPPQQYGAPPQQPYGAPPSGQYGQPPPPQGYPPPQQPYGAPPPGQYGAPPPLPPHPHQQQHQPYPAPPGQYGAPLPQGQYGQPPPPQQFGGAPYVAPTQPSLGYVPNQTAPMDVSKEVEGLYKAMKGFGTDEKTLIKILSKLDPIQINTVRLQYNQRFMKDLVRELEKETSGHFEKGLVAIARGPLTADCYALYEAVKGLGTKENILNDVLCNRSNADIHAIKQEYQRLFKKSLEADLRGDLSAATEQMFVMIVSAQRAEDFVQPHPQETEQDVQRLQTAIGNIVSKDPVQTCEILVKRNDAQLRAIMQAYHTRFHKSLESVIKGRFTGHMEDALMLILARARNRAESDAVQLEESMAGIGTKDILLVQRVVRAHWNRQHMQQVRAAYQTKYRKDLVKRIKGETSGDYERLMVACVE